jgi:hypothetical protein
VLSSEQVEISNTYTFSDIGQTVFPLVLIVGQQKKVWKLKKRANQRELVCGELVKAKRIDEDPTLRVQNL